jgi:formate hydrogenlyase subunit 3/multisubunit Na+/H+ antiporter MnhD subunit
VSAATALHTVLAVALGWLALGLAAVTLPRAGQVARVLFPLSAIASIVLVAAGGVALGTGPAAMILPLGLPDLPFHLRVDPLSGFFVVILGLGSGAVSLYSAGYFRHGVSLAATHAALLPGKAAAGEDAARRAAGAPGAPPPHQCLQ